MSYRLNIVSNIIILSKFNGNVDTREKRIIFIQFTDVFYQVIWILKTNLDIHFSKLEFKNCLPMYVFLCIQQRITLIKLNKIEKIVRRVQIKCLNFLIEQGIHRVI